MPNKNWNLLTLILLIVGLGWIGINRIPPTADLTPQALPPAPAVGHPAPDLALPLLAGGTFRLSEQVGTPVVLNFWATWCGPCRAELPELQAASERLAGQVQVIGVNQGEAAADVAAFADRLGLTFVVPLDAGATLSRQAYGIRSLPTTFFIDRQGIIRQIQVGPVTEATLSQLLKTIYP